tara:strand:+ start:561 stop:1112 length:552 start_codon:yes stop_codon:yes gene_type:complete
MKNIEAAAEVSNSNFATEKQNLVEEPSRLNSFIDKLFKNFLSSENKKTPEQNLSPNFKEDKIKSEDLKKFNYSSERNIQLEVSELGIGAKIRILDTIYGTKNDIMIFLGDEKQYNSISIYLKSCFYKKPNLKTESIALINIIDSGTKGGVYSGWLSSKQPHLTNFENYRYRFWLLSCIISDHE